MGGASTLRLAIEVSEAMRAAGANGEWGEVGRMAPIRDDLVRRVLADLDVPHFEESARCALLERLAALDAALLDLAGTELRRRGTRLREQKLATRATRVYLAKR